LGSTTAAGGAVEPGASVVGYEPTPASVTPCDVFGPICVGVPVWSVVTVAFVIAAANASTTGDETYVDAVGDVADDDGGTNEYDCRATGTCLRVACRGVVWAGRVCGTGLTCGSTGAACSLGVASGGNQATGTESEGSVDGGEGRTKAPSVGTTYNVASEITPAATITNRTVRVRRRIKPKPSSAPPATA
jgi:hypothetical protein